MLYALLHHHLKIFINFVVLGLRGRCHNKISSIGFFTWTVRTTASILVFLFVQRLNKDIGTKLAVFPVKKKNSVKQAINAKFNKSKETHITSLTRTMFYTVVLLENSKQKSRQKKSVHLNNVVVSSGLMRFIIFGILEQHFVHVSGGILEQLIGAAEDDECDLTITQN